MEEKQFSIGEELAQAILSYLATRPYQEVFRLIAALQQLKPVVIGEKD